MADSDDHLLLLFGEDPDEASDALRHVVLRLVKYFRWRRFPDPEDLAQEVLVRGLSRLGKGAVAPHPIRYFYGVARNVLREQRKKATNEVPSSLEDVMASLLPMDYRDPAIAILLDEDLSAISPDEADLLVRYHTEDRSQLAADLGIENGALRVRAWRAKDSLDRWIRDKVGARG